MNLEPAPLPRKADNFPSHVCRYIMARYDVSASLANTIAALALLGGAK